MFETITLDTDARGVATLTLNRPDKHNAMSARMIAELTEAAGQLSTDDSVRVVVLTGAGASFCAGGDLGWMRDQMAADRATRYREAERLALMLKALNEMPRPLIGRVQGQAFGGGVGLACICDVAIGVEDARFGLTETRLGIIPATIGPYVVARIGESMARRVAMSARRFGADEAVTLGILARSVPAEALGAAVEAEIAPYLACAPGAVADTKRLLRRLGPVIDDAVIARTITALVERWETDEAQAGITAFFDRSPPPWKA